MAFADSPTVQVVVILLLAGVLARFARRSLIHILTFLVLEVAVFVLFPSLLLHFVNLVSSIHHLFTP